MVVLLGADSVSIGIVVTLTVVVDRPLGTNQEDFEEVNPNGQSLLVSPSYSPHKLSLNWKFTSGQ